MQAVSASAGTGGGVSDEGERYSQSPVNSEHGLSPAPQSLRSDLINVRVCRCTCVLLVVVHDFVSPGWACFLACQARLPGHAFSVYTCKTCVGKGLS